MTHQHSRMAIRTWLSASKGIAENSNKKKVEYSEETYIEIHNLLLQDPKDEDNSELDAGRFYAEKYMKRTGAERSLQGFKMERIGGAINHRFAFFVSLRFSHFLPI